MDRNLMNNMDKYNLCFSSVIHEDLSSWCFGVSCALESDVMAFDLSDIGFSEFHLSIKEELPQDSFVCSLKIAVEEYCRDCRNFFVESPFVKQVKVLAENVIRHILSFRSAANAFLGEGNLLQANLGIFSL